MYNTLLENNDAAAMSAKEKIYSISDLAREFAITPRTIRFWEDKGMLAPQRAGDRRVYNYRDRGRLALILRLKQLGFSLAQITEFLSLYDADPAHVTQLKMGIHNIRSRIDDLESQIAEQQYMLSELKDLHDETIERLISKGVNPDTDL